MAAQSQPETSANPTQVFSGVTLEEALAGARAAYGSRVKIVRAQRVRRGVRGLLGQVRYDVHALVPEQVATGRPKAPQPKPAVAPPVHGRAGQEAPRVERTAAGERRLDDVLRDLVDAADEDEAVPAEPSWTWSGEEEVGALLTDVATLTTAARTDGVPVHPAPDLARHPMGADSTADTANAWRELLVSALHAPAAEGQPLVRTAPEVSPLRLPSTAPRFDRAALRSIGVPPAVLRRLPVEDPLDDAGWRRALQDAIAAVAPAPSEPDADHPIVVSGHGLAGALAVLRAAVEDGAVPGTISFQGRRRPATPAALVEVLAACASS